MPESGAWICGTGMMTAVGDSAAQTATSVRAGLSRYAESSVHNKRFGPMTLALLPEESLPPLGDQLQQVPGLTARHIRMLRLAELPLKEVAGLVRSLEQAPLFLATYEPSTDAPSPLADAFLQQLQLQTGIPFQQEGSKLFPGGRAGGLQALDSALAFLEGDEHDLALVGGVDTLLDLRELSRLDQEDRVLAEGVMDGFAPGEAAAFLLLASDRGVQTSALSPLARVHPPSLAQEEGHRYSEEPYRGDGLAEAVSGAVEALDAGPIRTVLASLNGENLGAKEWGVALLRNSSALDPAHEIEHPAQCFGDTGAAVGPLLLALGAIGMSKGYLPGPSLVWCSSDGAARGAACLTLSEES